VSCDIVGGWESEPVVHTTKGADMLLVGSDNAQVGFAEGMRILRRGGRALDAVEATIRRVEANPADHSVDWAGSRTSRARWSSTRV
jgi:isoaspartyl peptidase/L-asparaginase-like protein (Ntn-hydrolase superfamily)